MKKFFGNQDKDLGFKDIDIVDLGEDTDEFERQADDQYYEEDDAPRNDHGNGQYETDTEYVEGEGPEIYYAEGVYGDEAYVEGQQETSEQYTDEQYEDGQYADEQYEDGQYADEQYEDGQYTEEQYAEEEYVDEQYTDEKYEEEQYADEQYTQELPDAKQIKQESEPLYEEEEELPYDEELEALLLEEDGEWGLSSKRNQKSLIEKMGELETIDKIIMCTSILVLALAVVFGYYFLTGRQDHEAGDELASVGNQVQNIDVIGGIGLEAVENEAKAQLVAAQTVDYTPDETENPDTTLPTEYDELEYEKNVSVSLGMTSVKEDLKIKFVNKKTGKLVANVPFSVTITKPDKSTEIWSDDDMDGIIHRKEIAGGAYKVSVNGFSEERYADYTLPIGNQMVDVKSEISYKKVDVSDEIKKESEINVKLEDTRKNETVEESVLEDTVPWVESTAIVDTYTEILKSEVADPMKVINGGLTFTDTAYNGSISPGSGQISIGDEMVVTAMCFDDAGNAMPISNVVWYTSDGNIVTVNGADVNASVRGVSAGSAMISYEGMVTDISSGEGIRVAGSMSITVIDNTPAPDPKGSASLEQGNLVIAPGTSGKTRVVTSGFAPGKELEYAVSGGDLSVATISVDNAGNITVNGLKAGDTGFDISVNYRGGAMDTAVGMHLNVKVAANRTLVLDATERTITAGESTTVIASFVDAAGNVIPSDGSQGSFNIAISDGTIASASATGLTITFIGFKEGGTNATVTYTENGVSYSASIYIVVQSSARNDKTTKLLDNNKNQVYVFENEKYREAVYADYYTADKFFIRGEARYTGWQTIDGKVYYYTAEGKYVTGEQVIMGAKYNFASDGTLVTSSGTVGIDVSKWNGTIDWNAVRNSGVSYVIIRCGYRGSKTGAMIEDPKFAENMKGATMAGLKVGVYFFTQAIDEVEAVYEASFVLEKIKNYRISYPVFLDVEASGGRGDAIDYNKRTAVCKAFCETIRNAGYNAGIYANKTWLEKKLDPNALSGFKIWLAQYAAAPTYGGRYDLWQYKSKGKVSGISTDVDMNLSYLGY